MYIYIYIYIYLIECEVTLYHDIISIRTLEHNSSEISHHYSSTNLDMNTLHATS